MDNTSKYIKSSIGELHNVTVQSLKGEELKDLNSVGFCWRWKAQDNEFVRVVTLEKDSRFKQQQFNVQEIQLVPANFHFCQHIQGLNEMEFSRVGMGVKNGNIYHVLILKYKQSYDTNYALNVPSIQPQQLKWIPETKEDCSKYHFGTRFIDGFEVLTLETKFYYNENGIVPIKFQGLPDNVSGGFCWRWFKHQGKDYRVVTVEGPPLAEESNQELVVPDNLTFQGIDEKSLQQKYTFGLRSTLMHNKFVFKTVTLENGVSNPFQLKKFKPSNLRWTSETAENCSKYQFGLLGMKTDGQSYHLLLLQ